jgi:cellulose synthase/poly-beta-1,6-N-acetylglucosamine synthase-like glycosyltransferase
MIGEAHVSSNEFKFKVAVKEVLFYSFTLLFFYFLVHILHTPFFLFLIFIDFHVVNQRPKTLQIFSIKFKPLVQNPNTVRMQGCLSDRKKITKTFKDQVECKLANEL